ncbi:hypothetical protein ACFFMM_16645 [Micromonospora chaiyaphumensis]|uniref:Uncharacterized protein n=1 Tax=Micromonospora chaiyaphumensis TaxID=307119 RepID=A0A1C4WT12_9ACTN|nr:hypothetical protein [Micromonospora chaiyaphumensis]SCE99330.1 hypothetical protein GA0070214_104318 [Micromonospora chaiyaphumensis]
MFHVIWGQLRGRAGGSVALLVGVLVATTGLVVRTGAATTSRLAVTGTVERHTRAASRRRSSRPLLRRLPTARLLAEE